MKFGLYVPLNNALEEDKNVGQMVSKTGSWDQIMQIPILCLVNTLEATFLVQSSRNWSKSNLVCSAVMMTHIV